MILTRVNACGECRRCCQSTLVRVTQRDLKRWRQQQRYDIILCVESWMGSKAYLIHKKDRDECIFLTPDGCEIYETRPQVCRDFPKSQHQVERFECRLKARTHEPQEERRLDACIQR